MTTGQPWFGISVVPFAAAHRDIVEQVLAAERGGLDLVGIQDHPYQRRFLDTFALIADLLARTSRLRFFPDVASLPMRGPAMIAKAAASLDVMSGGRFELGLGAGSFWDAVAGMGGPRRTGGEAADALEEAIPSSAARSMSGPNGGSSAAPARTTPCRATRRVLPHSIGSRSGWASTSRAGYGWPAGSPTAGSAGSTTSAV